MQCFGEAIFMEAHLKQLQEHAEAIDAFKNSDEVKERFAALDQGAGRFLGPALAAVWTIVTLISMGAGYVAWHFLDGAKETAIFAIAAALGAYSIWRIYRAIKNPPNVSDMIASEIEDRVKPAKTALGVIKVAASLAEKK